MKYLLIVFFSFLLEPLLAQNDSIKKWNISGRIEIYYSYDFSSRANYEKPGFIYNHKRNNEISTNLAFIKANYCNKYLRANLGLMTGDYAHYNLMAEPTVAQFIYEANIGVKLSKKQNIWLDAGIMPSHIGFESAISADCWTLTRSMLAENSPYYETGVKIGFVNKKEKFLISFLALNGWQKIKRPDNINSPSFGLQATYKPSSKATINYSNFIGSDKPDSMKSLRTYHNFYLQYEPSKKFGIILGFDLGTDKYDLQHYGTWYSPVLILKQYLTNKSSISFRGEYFHDRKQIIILAGTKDGFQTYGLSSNLDYELSENVLVRIEGKIFHSKDKIFDQNTSFNNYSLTTNLSVKL